jgi:hypothetical protein
VEHDRNLVGAHTCDGVNAPQSLHQPPGDLPEQGFAAR